MINHTDDHADAQFIGTQHVETLVIGAGQAGLTTGYHLSQQGREFLIVDGSDRIGDNWRQQYDSLRLFTPAKYDGLTGLPFPAVDPWHFPTKDEVADYLEQYAVTFDLPVRLSTRVDRLTLAADGRFEATVGGALVTCDNVVVATGTFGRTPYLPEVADRLDPQIRQLHSRDYRSPDQLADGPVLVVGASHSGCDIAFELAASRETMLVGPDRGQLPVPWDSWRLKALMPVLRFGFAHVLTRRTPIGRKAMRHVRHHGGPMLRVQRADLARRGVERLTERVVGASPDGRPVLDGGRTLDVANVVWCTGYRQVFDWIDLPVLGDDGWPEEHRGVVESLPGLFFCGLCFQYSFSSMEISGVARDAAYVARRILERTPAGAGVPA